VSFYAPIACQSARPINLLIARLALALCTQGHSGWARDFERQARLILEIHYLRVSLVIMPPTGGVIPAMPVERIIDPACVRTIRRSPKRMSPDPTNNSTNHRTRGPSDHETSPGTKRRPDGIRL